MSIIGRRTALKALSLSMVAAGGRTAPVLAQPAVGPASFGVLTQLEGRWEGTGVILGQASRVQMEWAPALNARFMRLTFVSHIGPAPKTQRFEGHAYYQPAGEDRFRATWFDSSGQVRPIVASGTASTLVAAWGTADTELGETTYRLTTADRVEVVDRVRAKDGTWREFGRSTLSRTLRDA
jgi:hypothetical protein